MRQAEKQQVVTELHEICEVLKTYEKDPSKDLIRLAYCMAKLKEDLNYSKKEKADLILNMIESYTKGIMCIDNIVYEIEELIIELEKEESVLVNLKVTLDEAIPEEVKDACKEKAGQIKEITKEAKKSIKTKFRNWLLSEDEDE